MVVIEGWHHWYLVLVESLPHMLELLRHGAQVGGLVFLQVEVAWAWGVVDKIMTGPMTQVMDLEEVKVELQLGCTHQLQER